MFIGCLKKDPDLSYRKGKSFTGMNEDVQQELKIIINDVSSSREWNDQSPSVVSIIH